jgi:hypothetical protein
MLQPKSKTCTTALATACLCVATACSSFSTQAQNPATTRAWSSPSLPPAQRAALVLKEMTLDEKIAIVHGQGMVGEHPGPSDSNGGAAFQWGFRGSAFLQSRWPTQPMV